MANPPISLAVLTPHTDDITGNYVSGLISLGAELGRIGVPMAWADVANELIPQARNRLARGYLLSPFTHCLWVDSDNSVAPGVVSSMLALDVDFVSAPYVLRLKSKAASDRKWSVVVSDFDQNPVNGAIRVECTGFGTVLLRRRVIETLSATVPKYRQRDALIANVFGEFVANETYHNEDTAFSSRWRDAGGDIWALLDAETNHDGQIGHYGREVWDRRAELDSMPSRAMAAQ